MDDRLKELFAAIGLEAQAARFAEEEVAYDDLASLSDQDLEGLGLKLGPRKRLRAELAKRAAGGGAPAAAAPAAEAPPAEAPAETPAEAPAETPPETPAETPPEASSDSSSSDSASSDSSSSDSSSSDSSSDSSSSDSSSSDSSSDSSSSSEEAPPAEAPPEEPPPPPPPPARVRVSLVPATDASWDAATKGWHGETLPKGMKRGAEAPVLLWNTGQELEIEMVYVPPGDFLMGHEDGGGDDRPQHTHTIEAGYYIGRHPITWKQYKKYLLKKNLSLPKTPTWGIKDTHPVINVAWLDASEFCKWAGLSLPSEAQWVRAAAGPDGFVYPWGDEAPDPSRCAFADNTTYGGKTTAPIGTFPDAASPYGAHDMSGNVCEWCQDWYDSNIFGRYALGDFKSPASGDMRVVKGGGYTDQARIIRIQMRQKKFPSFWGETVGFRVAKNVTK